MTLATTVVPSLCIALVVWAFVSTSRDRFPKLYALKRIRGHTARKPDSWVSYFYRTRDVELISHKSLDAYLLLRYLRFCVLLCLGGCAALCAVLLPLNSTGGGGMSQLDRLTLANIKRDSPRLYAHACCTCVYFGWVMYMLARERVFYIQLKHALFTSNMQANRSKSRTVLFTDVPEKLRYVEFLKQCFESHGEVDVWLVTAKDSLRRDTRRHEALKDRLDTITTRRDQNLRHEISLEAGISSNKLGRSKEKDLNSMSSPNKRSTDESEAKCRDAIEALDIHGKQGLHRRRSLGIPEDVRGFVLDTREKEVPSVLQSIFVRFDTVKKAQLAFRSRHHDELSKFTPRCIDTAAKEIIWTSLGLDWKSRFSRGLLSQIFIITLIVFWSFPVAFATAMTNMDTLLPHFRWRERSPELVRHAVDGLLPSILLSLLMALPPMIISLMGRFSGLVNRAEVEIYLHNYYFWFRIVQVFLVAALGSTASSILTQIYSHPSGVTTILAKRLPGASNFYFSYLVVQGFSESAFVLLNLSGLFSRYVLTRILDDTPLKRSRRQEGLFQVSIGTVLATYCSLLVIALCYAPAAPLMLCFATIAFTMFYMAHRYNLFFTVEPEADTKGKLYVGALKHTLVGLYLGELFLIGLLTISAIDGREVSGPLVISCVLLACTAIYHKKTEDVFKRWEARVPCHEVMMELRTRESKKCGQQRYRFVSRWLSKFVRIFLDRWDVVRRSLKEDDVLTPDTVEEYLAPEVIGSGR